MADQTLGAVGSLLGVLGTAIKDEESLLSGVERDIQFIRDEMDSMNGFLMHVTKTEKHDDQLRAWMKQVRDITYVADDNIKLYKRYLTPPAKTCCTRLLCNLPVKYHYLLRHVRTRRRVAQTIRDLRDRVREVGERRKRYDVKLPDAAGDMGVLPLSPQDRKTEEDREKFLTDLEDGCRRALEDGKAEASCHQYFKSAIEALNLPPRPRDDTTKSEASAVTKEAPAEAIATAKLEKKETNAVDGLEKNKEANAIVDMLGGAGHVDSVKMLLCSLYSYPCGTIIELDNLSTKLKEPRADVSRQVMLSCYSKLPVHYKSCLQYLTTFEEEESISRTSLVRRWLAEGLVVPNDDGDHSLDEEAGERCFDELVFQGFLSPAPGHRFPRFGSLKLKCCVLGGSVKKFIMDMSKSENFVDNLPTHLRHQINIRKMARRPPPPEQHKPWWPQSTICGVPRTKAVAASGGGDNNDQLKHPMDEMVTLLKNLAIEYRLNVLDLGGCQGLKMKHLENICKVVPSLKYLSLRKTNVYRLPYQMNNLLHLETLDIRQTRVQGDALRVIVLDELKHLLAGDSEAEVISTVLMPPKIGKNTEILRHVQIKDGREAQRFLYVSSLERLRKLGVVLDGREDNIKLLLTTIARRSDTLRSLSVWITEPAIGGGEVFVTLDTKGNSGDGAPLFSLPSRLESLNLKCFNGRNNNTAGSIPQWIKQLKNLSKITLHHSLLDGEGLRELSKMERLRCLKLCRESYIGAKVTLKYEEFKELRLLVLDHISGKMTNLEFEDGATPKLEKIVWNYDRKTTSVEIAAENISGITNLRDLREIRINDVNIFKPFPPRCLRIED